MPPYAEHAEKLAEQKWTILGEIAKADPVALGLTEAFGSFPSGTAGVASSRCGSPSSIGMNRGRNQSSALSSVGFGAILRRRPIR